MLHECQIWHEKAPMQINAEESKVLAFYSDETPVQKRRHKEQATDSLSTYPASFHIRIAFCLTQRRRSARTCSSRCTLTPAARTARSAYSRLACCTSRDPLRDEIREVGRGLSLADTQQGHYVRLYSRRRLCARRSADAESSFDLVELVRIRGSFQNFLPEHNCPYN